MWVIRQESNVKNYPLGSVSELFMVQTTKMSHSINILLHSNHFTSARLILTMIYPFWAHFTPHFCQIHAIPRLFCSLHPISLEILVSLKFLGLAFLWPKQFIGVRVFHIIILLFMVLKTKLSREKNIRTIFLIPPSLPWWNSQYLY